MSCSHDATRAPIVSGAALVDSIQSIRGERVILDSVLAVLYGVAVGRLNEAVRRNRARFPPDFMFQLTAQELSNLKSQTVISSRGGRRHRPYAFTEQGVAMLSSVLRSPRAVAVNIEIMRAFVRLRRWMADSRELTARLDELESRYDSQFKVVFDAIRQLMEAVGAVTRVTPRRRGAGRRAATRPPPSGHGNAVAPLDWRAGLDAAATPTEPMALGLAARGDARPGARDGCVGHRPARL